MKITDKKLLKPIIKKLLVYIKRAITYTIYRNAHFLYLVILITIDQDLS